MADVGRKVVVNKVLEGLAVGILGRSVEALAMNGPKDDVAAILVVIGRGTAVAVSVDAFESADSKDDSRSDRGIRAGTTGLGKLITEGLGALVVFAPAKGTLPGRELLDVGRGRAALVLEPSPWN